LIAKPDGYKTLNLIRICNDQSKEFVDAADFQENTMLKAYDKSKK